MFLHKSLVTATVLLLALANVALAEDPPPQIFCVSAGNTVDITVDDASNIYYTEIGVGVHKLTSQGQHLLTWGAELFNTATGIVAGQDGYVYVCDLNHGMVRKFTQNGVHVLSWIIPVFENYSQPYGIDQAPDGSIWVCDAAQGQVVNFTSVGELIQHWPSRGIGIAVDNNGELVYVSTGNLVSVYDTLGNPVRTWPNPGNYNLETDPVGFVYLATNSLSGVVKYDRFGVEQYSLVAAPYAVGVAVSNRGLVYATTVGYVCAFGHLSISVEPSTWTNVKTLYR